MRGYEPAQTRFFSGGIQTGCGAASSAVGPFYCPADRYVYIDLGFFDELQSQLGARGGPLAEAYILAHEYGHHVQNLTGVLRTPTATPARRAARSGSSCRPTATRGCGSGNALETGFLEELTRQDVADALDAAAAVGDDRIQERAQGRVTPETLDARLVRAAPELVRARHRGLRAAELRHLQRPHLRSAAGQAGGAEVRRVRRHRQSSLVTVEATSEAEGRGVEPAPPLAARITRLGAQTPTARCSGPSWSSSQAAEYKSCRSISRRPHPSIRTGPPDPEIRVGRTVLCPPLTAARRPTGCGNAPPVVSIGNSGAAGISLALGDSARSAEGRPPAGLSRDTAHARRDIGRLES